MSKQCKVWQQKQSTDDGVCVVDGLAHAWSRDAELKLLLRENNKRMNGWYELAQLYKDLVTIWGSLFKQINMQDLYLNTKPVLLLHEG